ncbi:pyridoxamine 5'-phosphate oxidase family protein [uncultured Thermomonospora sp.]|uniref:pyridoxamine 5'-phosphate oxidase family protein n=1 Tax=uncultured Thermomonospora sp. TaxID=671175 RepID=UPI00259B0E04|nr:pyridoxamine 5'-phosphate oxidase family protein [uncultured Thermomonospora sp.]
MPSSLTVPDRFPAAADAPRRRIQRLRSAESLRLAGTSPLGRLVFNLYGVPTIRPVNHIVEGEDIIFRTHGDSAVVEALGTGEMLVAYEVDHFDLDARLGWSVVINGTARRVLDVREAARYLALTDPWLDNGRDKNYVIRIHPKLVFGFQVVPDEE